ncbi:MAG: NRDE family protein [Planctomycetes bacterium]|nr:NRDE family protein [Planctomycetota bacterium]
MCVLTLFVGLDRDIPLVIGANRDERVARLSAPPKELRPGVVGPQDLEGGGTWFAVNRHGLVVAVTNRRTPAKTPDSYSRGLVALEALDCRALG